MKAQIINPFLISTIDVFKKMFNINIHNESPYVVQEQYEHRWDISGVIGIVGATEGIVAIRITRTMALKLLIESEIAENVLDDTDYLLRELVGELTNIIAGNSISKIDIEDIDITVPTTIQGKNHTVSWPSKSQIISVPFSTMYGVFEVHVSLST